MKKKYRLRQGLFVVLSACILVLCFFLPGLTESVFGLSAGEVKTHEIDPISYKEKETDHFAILNMLAALSERPENIQMIELESGSWTAEDITNQTISIFYTFMDMMGYYMDLDAVGEPVPYLIIDSSDPTQNALIWSVTVTTIAPVMEVTVWISDDTIQPLGFLFEGNDQEVGAGTIGPYFASTNTINAFSYFLGGWVEYENGGYYNEVEPENYASVEEYYYYQDKFMASLPLELKAVVTDGYSTCEIPILCTHDGDSFHYQVGVVLATERESSEITDAAS